MSEDGFGMHGDYLCEDGGGEFAAEIVCRNISLPDIKTEIEKANRTSESPVVYWKLLYFRFLCLFGP